MPTCPAHKPSRDVELDSHLQAAQKFADALKRQREENEGMVDIRSRSEIARAKREAEERMEQERMEQERLRRVAEFEAMPEKTRQEWFINQLAAGRKLRRKDYEVEFGLSRSAALGELRMLQAKIDFVGTSRSGFYRLKDQGNGATA